MQLTETDFRDWARYQFWEGPDRRSYRQKVRWIIPGVFVLMGLFFLAIPWLVMGITMLIIGIGLMVMVPILLKRSIERNLDQFLSSEESQILFLAAQMEVKIDGIYWEDAQQKRGLKWEEIKAISVRPQYMALHHAGSQGGAALLSIRELPEDLIDAVREKLPHPS
ncbi:MAG: hypothetical protein AAF206_08855 [Bacteroidota bacterium]